MDGYRFEALARRLGGGSRRSLLRRAAAALFAGAAIGSGGAALAACKPPGGRCGVSADCCSQSCVRRKHRCRNCPSGQKFCAATASCIAADQCCGTCPSGQTCCSPPGQCFDTRNDKAHCGGCVNHECPASDSCLNGHCAQSCGAALECNAGCGCFDRVGAAGKACAFDQFLNCADVGTTCTSDAGCGFGDGCFAACPGVTGVCLTPCA